MDLDLPTDRELLERAAALLTRCENFLPHNMTALRRDVRTFLEQEPAAMPPAPRDKWSAFLTARSALLLEWLEEGKTVPEMAELVSCSAEQVALILKIWPAARAEQRKYSLDGSTSADDHA